jgi:pimeloyl-ACP methyl ester carboxylesterase
MDLRGRGLSAKPDTGYSVEYHMGDIHALLEEQGIDSVTLLGHSLGAYISLAYAANYVVLYAAKIAIGLRIPGLIDIKIKSSGFWFNMVADHFRVTGMTATSYDTM